MKSRLKKKIFTNMYNPKMNYSINQILIATKGLFITPLLMKNGYRYYMSHYFGKITKFENEGTVLYRRRFGKTCSVHLVDGEPAITGCEDGIKIEN